MRQKAVVEKKKLDEKKGIISNLELNLKRVTSSGRKQEKEIHSVLESASEYQRQVAILEDKVDRHRQGCQESNLTYFMKVRIL